MNSLFRLISVALITALLAACAGAPNTATNTQVTGMSAMPGVQAPAGSSSGNAGPPRLEWAESLAYEAEGPYIIDLAEVPAGVFDPNNQLDRKGAAGRPESPISEELADRGAGRV